MSGWVSRITKDPVTNEDVCKIESAFRAHIDNSNLTGLRTLYAQLEGTYFCHFDSKVMQTNVKKFEHILYKLYLIEAFKKDRKDKISEFFDKLALDLTSCPDWKDWFLLPHLKTIEDTPPYSTIDNKSYRAAIWTSFKNFMTLSISHAMILNCNNKNQCAVEIMDDFFSIAQPK